MILDSGEGVRPPVGGDTPNPDPESKPLVVYGQRHTIAGVSKHRDRKRSTMVSLRLPVPLLGALRKRAEDAGETLSDTVRELLAAGLSDWSSTESETKALRSEIRALREEVRAALEGRKSR